MSVAVSSQSEVDSLLESNEDLYAVFKALQRQEEFLDIQVHIMIFACRTVANSPFQNFRRNMLKMKCEISSES
jgi:hypothetical protein